MTAALSALEPDPAALDDDALSHYLVIIAFDEPFGPTEAASVRIALAGALPCTQAMVCDVDGNPLDDRDPDRERCGLVVAQWRGEDGIDAMEGVLAVIPREHPGLVGCGVREIYAVRGAR